MYVLYIYDNNFVFFHSFFVLLFSLNSFCDLYSYIFKSSSIPVYFTLVFSFSLCSGSDTLRRWQSLATPHLGHVLEHRPGIQIKGEVGVDIFEEDPYSLSDYEEDGKNGGL